MLNVNNIGLMLYQTVQVATLAFIIQVNFFSQTRCHHLVLTQDHNTSVSVQLSLLPLHAVLTFTNKEKVQCVLWSYSPCEILMFF